MECIKKYGKLSILSMGISSISQLMEESKLVAIDYTESLFTRNIFENMIAYLIPRIGKDFPSYPIFFLNWIFIP